jgi:hypothetical protein
MVDYAGFGLGQNEAARAQEQIFHARFLHDSNTGICRLIPTCEISQAIRPKKIRQFEPKEVKFNHSCNC